MLQERAAARGVKLPGKVASDPKDLGKVLTDLHEKPGRSGHPGGWRLPASRASARVEPDHDMLSSPMAKAVLAGIAAIVVKNMMGRRGRREAAPGSVGS